MMGTTNFNLWGWQQSLIAMIVSMLVIGVISCVIAALLKTKRPMRGYRVGENYKEGQ